MKILVIRFSSIGDIVLTSPVIRCLKKQLPDVEIHTLTKPQFKGIFDENPYIERVHLLEPHFADMIKKLRAEHFDYIVDLHNNLRSWRVRLALGLKSSGFPKLNFQKFILVKFKVNLLPKVHIVERYFKAVSRLGVKNDEKGLDFFIPQADRMKVNDLPVHLQKAYYAFVIGGNHFTKILPVHQVVSVIQLFDKPFVLLGGKEDEARGASIEAETNGKAWNSCGKLRLGQSAWLIGHAQAVISNDTGLMHIAAALRKPIVSVWGNTVPEFGMTPYMITDPEKSILIEKKGLSCRPCSKIGYPSCPKGHFNCMEKLDPAAIAAALRKVAQDD